MPITAEAPAPNEALILPSPSEEVPLDGMPKPEQLVKWQNYVNNHQRFVVRDKKSALIVGSEGAMICEYFLDAMFPQHDTVKRSVKYRFNVVMAIERKEDMKHLPLPSFFCDVDKFFKLFVES